MAITARRPGEEESGVHMSDAALNLKSIILLL